jgi:hypothetical protein
VNISLDLVVVFNSKHPESEGVFNGQWILAKYIVPAALPTAAPREEIRLDPEATDQYQGDYLSVKWSETISILKDRNRVYIRESDQEKGKLNPDTEDIFYVNTDHFGEIQIAFTRDDNGDVKGLVAQVGFFGLQFDKVK